MGAIGLHVLVTMAMTICLALVANGASHGTATFYTPPYVNVACGGSASDGAMIAAASDVLWNDGEACGKKYRIKCTGATNLGVPEPCRGANVVVKIIDYCPEDCRGTIDLSQAAFKKIADPDAGKIKIEYVEVE